MSIREKIIQRLEEGASPFEKGPFFVLRVYDEKSSKPGKTMVEVQSPGATIVWDKKVNTNDEAAVAQTKKLAVDWANRKFKLSLKADDVDWEMKKG